MDAKPFDTAHLSELDAIPVAGHAGVAADPEPKSTVLAIGGPRDEAFHPSAWEWWFAAQPHVEAGEYDKAAEMLTAGLPEHPDNPSLLYNLGCFEALAGDHDAATAHVQRALELKPELREHAASDPDLGPIRDRL